MENDSRIIKSISYLTNALYQLNTDDNQKILLKCNIKRAETLIKNAVTLLKNTKTDLRIQKIEQDIELLKNLLNEKVKK